MAKKMYTREEIIEVLKHIDAEGKQVGEVSSDAGQEEETPSPGAKREPAPPKEPVGSR